MFNLKEMAREEQTTNLEHDGAPVDTIALFEDGYEAGFNEAQIEQGFAVVEEATQDMDTLVEARAMVETNLENGDVTPELGEAYRATMLRMEGKYGINGLADANLESADAVKGFLKNLAANAAKIIAQIAAMAKKTWLKFAAWVATSDAKVKELTKKLEKLKEDGKVLTIKGEDKAVAYFKKEAEHDALNGPVEDGDVLKKILAQGAVLRKYDIDKATKAVEDIATVSKIPSGAIPISKPSDLEFDNSKIEEIAKATGTTAYLVGVSVSSVTVLLVNEQFSPEDYDGDPYMVYKTATLKRDIDLDKLAENKATSAGATNSDSEVKFTDFDNKITMLKELPKGADVQKLIKKGFDKLGKASKEVEKKFNKPEEWAEKAKAASAAKDAYVASSKAIYSIVRFAISEYRATMNVVNSYASLPAKKA